MAMIGAGQQIARPEQLVGVHVGHGELGVQRAGGVRHRHVRRVDHLVHAFVDDARHDREGRDDADDEEHDETNDDLAEHSG